MQLTNNEKKYDYIFSNVILSWHYVKKWGGIPVSIPPFFYSMPVFFSFLNNELYCLQAGDHMRLSQTNKVMIHPFFFEIKYIFPVDVLCVEN